MVAIGQVHLVFDRARRHQKIPHRRVFVGERGWNQDYVRTHQRQASHRFRIFHVVADQQPDTESAETERRFEPDSATVGRAFVVAEQMRLAIMRQGGTVGTDHLHRVINIPAPQIALGIAVGNGNVVVPRDGRDKLRRQAIGALRQRGHRSADVITAQPALRA